MESEKKGRSSLRVYLAKMESLLLKAGLFGAEARPTGEQINFRIAHNTKLPRSWRERPQWLIQLGSFQRGLKSAGFLTLTVLICCCRMEESSRSLLQQKHRAEQLKQEKTALTLSYEVRKTVPSSRIVKLTQSFAPDLIEIIFKNSFVTSYK